MSKSKYKIQKKYKKRLEQRLKDESEPKKPKWMEELHKKRKQEKPRDKEWENSSELFNDAMSDVDKDNE